MRRVVFFFQDGESLVYVVDGDGGPYQNVETELVKNIHFDTIALLKR